MKTRIMLCGRSYTLRKGSVCHHTYPMFLDLAEERQDYRALTGNYHESGPLWREFSRYLMSFKDRNAEHPEDVRWTWNRENHMRLYHSFEAERYIRMALMVMDFGFSKHCLEASHIPVTVQSSRLTQGVGRGYPHEETVHCAMPFWWNFRRIVRIANGHKIAATSRRFQKVSAEIARARGHLPAIRTREEENLIYALQKAKLASPDLQLPTPYVPSTV